ncbi:MAG: insulinase family protein [Clostridia bacterium]|nr:insulinase family protein [Clostridia bacterium]
MALNTFSNGLRLVCIPKKEKKVACVVLHIAGGTQSEKNYQSGISDYLTKIMLMGTKKHSTREALLNYAKSNGIILTPHNSKESITISAVCPRESIPVAVELLSEIAFDTTFSLENGDKVRRMLLSQVALLAENPVYILDRLINTSLYYRTGLANPKSGTNISVSRFRPLDAKDYLDRIFTPRNTIISVVGDTTQEEIYDLVKLHFFDRMKDSEKEYKKLKYVSAVEDFSGDIKGRIKRLNQTRISIVFPTVSFKEKEKYLIEIVKPILIKNIKLALSNQNYYFDTKIKTKYYANNGNINFEITVDYDFAVDHLYNFMEALNTDIKNRAISSEEFETEKKVYITEFMNTCDNVLEGSLLSAKTLALTKQAFSENGEKLKIEMLTNKDANKVLKEVLNFEKMLITYVGHDFDVDYEDLLSTIQ